MSPSGSPPSSGVGVELRFGSPAEGVCVIAFIIQTLRNEWEKGFLFSRQKRRCCVSRRFLVDCSIMYGEQHTCRLRSWRGKFDRAKRGFLYIGANSVALGAECCSTVSQVAIFSTPDEPRTFSTETRKRVRPKSKASEIRVQIPPLPPRIRRSPSPSRESKRRREAGGPDWPS